MGPDASNSEVPEFRGFVVLVPSVSFENLRNQNPGTPERYGYFKFLK
jgi:hypothetical protein